MSDTPTPAGTSAAAPAASNPSWGPVQSLADELKAKFALADAAVKVQRATRLWVEVDQAGFAPVFDHLVKNRGFCILCTITGLDLGADLGLIYHLALDRGIMANVKTRVPKGVAMTSVTPYFPGAAIYEREVEDLLGATFTGRPEMPRYPLPEDWPQGDHPLLKDWKPRTATAAETAAPAAGTPAAAPAPAAAAAPTGEKGAASNV